MASNLPRLVHTRYQNADKERTLNDALTEAIAFRIELLSENTSFIKNWFTQYLTVRNISAIYILALIAAIGAAISAVVGIIALFVSLSTGSSM